MGLGDRQMATRGGAGEGRRILDAKEKQTRREAGAATVSVAGCSAEAILSVDDR